MTETEEKSNAYIIKRLGTRYTNTTLDNFRGNCSTKVKELFLSGKNIYIYGECGSGKTHLLSGLARLALSKSFGITKGDRINEIASDPYGEYFYSTLHLWQNTAILFIDDIGMGRLTQQRQEFYYKILDYRIGNNLQTVYTSNIKVDNLWRGEGDEDPSRLIRRIRENGEGVQL